jgi:hypothetical protein
MQTSHKYTLTDLEIKITIIHKYIGWQRLSAFACELRFAVSTVNNIVKECCSHKRTC